jgi:hypothetical protein
VLVEIENKLKKGTKIKICCIGLLSLFKQQEFKNKEVNYRFTIESKQAIGPLYLQRAFFKVLIIAKFLS